MIDRHSLIKAFWKIPTKDKVVLLLTFSVVVGVIFSFLFKDMNLRGLPGGDGVADSTLTDFGDGQTYRKGEYTDLDICVQYPGTSYAVNVGGEINNASQTGQSFSYGKGMTLFVMEAGKEQATAQVMEQNLPIVLGFIGEGASYKQKLTDTGYMNKIHLEYQGGTLRTDDIYTIMTYRFEEVPNISLIMGVSCDRSADTGEGKKLLDKVFYTLSELEADTVSLNAPLTDGADGDAMVPVSDSSETDTERDDTSFGTIAQGTDEVKERYRKLDELDKAHDEEIIKMNAGKIPYWETNIEVPGGCFGKEMAFVFSYTNLDVTANEAILSAPNGGKYEPSYNNDRLDGRIVFYVKSPMEGVWHLKISLNGVYGNYLFNVMERQGYDDSVIPNGMREDTLPRDY